MIKPQNTENTLYIEKSFIDDVEELVASIDKYWPGVDLANVMIDVEEIQVAGFGYDQYDPADYIEYYVLTLS